MCILERIVEIPKGIHAFGSHAGAGAERSLNDRGLTRKINIWLQIPQWHKYAYKSMSQIYMWQFEAHKKDTNTRPLPRTNELWNKKVYNTVMTRQFKPRDCVHTCDIPLLVQSFSKTPHIIGKLAHPRHKAHWTLRVCVHARVCIHVCPCLCVCMWERQRLHLRTAHTNKQRSPQMCVRERVCKHVCQRYFGLNLIDAF